MPSTDDPLPSRRGLIATAPGRLVLYAGVSLAGLVGGLLAAGPDAQSTATLLPPGPTAAAPLLRDDELGPAEAELRVQIVALEQERASVRRDLARLQELQAALEAKVHGMQAEESAAAARVDMLGRSQAQLKAETAQMAATREELAAEIGMLSHAAEAAPGPAPAPAPAAVSEPAPRRDAPRIVVHHRAGDASSIAQANATVATLAARGLPVAEVRPVPLRVAAPRIRYFFSDDAAGAAPIRDALAAVVGGRPAVQDFTDYRPLPPPGTIEVWLAGG